MSYLIILPILIIFITCVLGFIVYSSNRKDSRNLTLFLIILLSAFWIASSFIADHMHSLKAALFWTRTAIIPPAFVLPALLYFSVIFPVAQKYSKWKILLLFIPALVYFLLSFTSLNVSNVSIQSWGADYTPGLLYIVFIPYFIIYFSITLHNFYKSYKSGDRVVKAQTTFILFGLLAAFLIGILTNVILPLAGNGKISVLGPSIAILFLAGSNTYAILKHHLFNIKVVASELLSFIIWIFLLVQVLLADTSSSRIVYSILFGLVIFFGVLLIRSVINEVHQRESLQILTEELKGANSKLSELDKLKTEFLGLASHQLRSPLTSISGGASMLLEGSYGQIANQKQQTVIDQILQSSRNLSRVIEDLLNVSKIEQGGMKYEMQKVDVKKILTEAINELKISANQKGLDLTLVASSSEDYLTKADSLKLHQVFLNLIDNSIKYTQHGYIKVLITKADTSKIRVAIEDTGIGIAPETISKLFQKFSRGEGRKVNVGGSGLGLYLAKEIITGHRGQIWAESEGINKGTTVNIELIKYEL